MKFHRDLLTDEGRTWYRDQVRYYMVTGCEVSDEDIDHVLEQCLGIVARRAAIEVEQRLGLRRV